MTFIVMTRPTTVFFILAERPGEPLGPADNYDETEQSVEFRPGRNYPRPHILGDCLWTRSRGSTTVTVNNAVQWADPKLAYWLSQTSLQIFLIDEVKKLCK